MRRLAVISTAETVQSAARLAAPLAALLLGALILLATGFASIPIAHNAAHDARHSFAFPCH
ncbi:MAG TPA: CbtB domain-containing protein [Stellaceae bacterium]|nr:CbtB domain-containing protein [Stellaceae bacterium]